MTPQQETVIDVLTNGKTVTDTVKAIEGTRQTASECLTITLAFRPR